MDQYVQSHLINGLLPSHRRADPIRPEKRVKLRVACRTRTSIPSTLVDGRLREGEHEIVVYASDVPAIKDKVETEESLWQQARALHDRKRREYIAKHWRGVVPEDESQWDESLKALAYKYTGSPEAEFYAIMNRGRKPLLSVEVLEELPPPGDNDARATQGGPDPVKDLAERLERLERENAELRDAVQRANNHGGKRR